MPMYQMQEDNPQSEATARIINFLQRYRAYFFFGFSIVFFSGVLALALSQHSRQDEAVLGIESQIEANAGASLRQNSGEILVDVAGAVKNPGVYKLPANSRVEQAIVVAGGFDEAEVDREFIAMELNLAAKVVDGQKLYILHKGESRATVPRQILGTTSQGSGKISVNGASTTELESLPGVGSVTAQKIISSRPYQSLEELVTKKAVSNSTYVKLKDLVVL